MAEKSKGVGQGGEGAWKVGKGFDIRTLELQGTCMTPGAASGFTDRGVKPREGLLKHSSPCVALLIKLSVE